jgi:hypothetical protein
MMDKMLESMLGQVVTIGQRRRWRSYLYHFRGRVNLKWSPMGKRRLFPICMRKRASKSGSPAGSEPTANQFKNSFEESLAMAQCRRGSSLQMREVIFPVLLFES